jgi:chromosome segregation ATPase
MSDLTNKDAEQDTKIAVMDSTLENSIRRIEMVHKRVDDTNEEIEKLRERVRKLERWVWSAGAVITALITIVGIADALNAKEIDYGRYGSTQQEVVLQLPRS